MIGVPQPAPLVELQPLIVGDLSLFVLADLPFT
jgi:hypothetical protein